MAVNLAPGANALDDLLAQITALGEAERAVLAGFLGQIAALDVDSIGGNAFDDTQGFNRCRSNGRCAGSEQGLPQRGDLLHGSPQGKVLNNRSVGAKEPDRDPV